MDMEQGTEQQDVENYYTDEDYKIWKKNTPFLYDFLVATELEWPSNTIEWLGDSQPLPNSKYEIQRFVIGTRTNDTEQNYLTVHRLNLPILDTKNVSVFRDEKDLQSGYGQATTKIESYVKIPHHGDVRRARVKPQDSLFVATQSSAKKIYVFDISRISSEPSKDGAPATGVTTLEAEPGKGNTAAGDSLSWNNKVRGELLSTTDDGNVYLWDVEAGRLKSQFRHHDKDVFDVEWHDNGRLFGSVGQDSMIKIWDSKSPNVCQHLITDSTVKDINCISFNPHSEFIFLTGGSDGKIALWDLRNITVRLHEFDNHVGEINQVNWSPVFETVFASCSTDKRVMIWDLNRITGQSGDENEGEEPSELIFVHGGHTDSVADFAWNGSRPFMLASVADNNTLHIWQQIGLTNPYSENYFNPHLDGESMVGSSVSDGDA